MADVTSIAEAFRRTAARYAQQDALTSRNTRISYRELDQWSDAVAAALIARELPLDAPIALVLEDAVALVPAVLGAIKAGHAFVAIDATDPDERVAAILSASGASVRIGDRDILPLRERSQPAALPSRPPNELVQLLFTSGTTGRPKGVAHRQRGLVERALRQSAVTGREAGQRVSYTALPGFARATYEILGSLLNGATLCAFDARRETLDDLATFIVREQISVLTLTPALFRRFLQVMPADLDLSSIRKLRIGADVMTVADVEAFKKRFPRTCTLERGFNATETGMVTHLTITHDTPIPGPLVPIGRPRPGMHVRLVDEQGNDVAEGEPGEMLVTGSLVASEYWNDAELSAQKFIQDPADPDRQTFRTGDLVKRDTDGLHYFLGRTDSRLKIHGRRIDPLEVEAAILQHCGVREVVAVGKPDAQGELQLCAYVVMNPGVPFVPRTIRAALRANVPPSLIPSLLFALDAVPITRAGKVDRAALQARIEPEDRRDPIKAEDPIEQALLALWSRVLDRPVDPDEDYFDDLGGDSIRAAHLVAEVQRTLGRTMPLSLLLELNTVSKMADYLRTRADQERLAVVVQTGSSDRLPLFLVSGKGGSVIVFREFARQLGPEQPVIGLTHDGFVPQTFPRTFAAMAACYVDAIRRIQPEGPYQLGGYSAGGLLAFDVARQLTQAGHAVRFLGLIDTALDNRLVPRWKRVLKHADLLRKHPRSHLPRYATAISRRVRATVRWMRGQGFDLYPEVQVPPLQQAYMAVRKREAVQAWSGHVTLFVARHGWGTDAIAPDLGWKPYCAELEIVDVDGEHLTVLREDVASLGRAMREALARAAR
jgi:amino acid adenylation domain-containing protein